ncbi:MAG: orotidine-5'-phosphate decarboxylase [Candidatus Lokiarchaeota archaeon]|nr:orotidine-5'-phosphate decarboxylase [Candidatus Lokiarchaeota archaeon]
MHETLFSEKLIDKIKEKKSYICIGLDPNFEGKKSIPNFLLRKHNNNHNAAILEFNKQIIDSTHKLTPIYKPQIAFYEKYNAQNALEHTIDYIHKKNCLAILDAKRNDIGNTSKAYKNNIFGTLNADATTLNAYLGIDSIKPFIQDKGKGVFILVKTSNQSSGDFQDKYLVSGMLMNVLNHNIELDNIENGGIIKKSENGVLSLKFTKNLLKMINEQDSIVKSGELELFNTNYIAMARLVHSWGKSTQPAFKTKYPYTNVGAVVGATYPEQLKVIRHEIPNSIILIPGYGAQGGTAKDIIHGFNEDGFGAIINSSRGINYAYVKEIKGQKYSETEYGEAATASACLMRNSINQVLKEANLI